MKKKNNSLVALIGRPNVGKSTLFNRMTGSRDAIVDPTPGVTRDRHYAEVKWGEHRFWLVDTGGLDDGGDDIMADGIHAQAMQAMEEADVILFLMDGRAGLLPADFDIARTLRTGKKPVLHVVNKIDSAEQEVEFLAPFYELGVDCLHPLSAEHRYGYNSLMTALCELLDETGVEEEEPENTIRLAFLGRPNVGKSSMVNRIMGEERMVVSDVSGTTRDAVDIFFSKGNYNYRLIDTAGIRRKGKTKDKLEKFSILKALKSLKQCDIALVLIDAAEGITEQDTKILGYTRDEGRGCIILLNKWDLVADDPERCRQILEEVKMATVFMPYAPVFKVSAKTGYGISRLFPAAGSIYRQLQKRFSTGQLNRLLQKAVERHQPALHRGRRLKFYYMAQLGVAPPLFALVTNYPKGVHFSYKRYLVNQLREGLGLDRVPIRILYRQRKRRTKKR